MIQEAERELPTPAEGIELRIPTEDDMSFMRCRCSDPETMQPVGGFAYLSDEQAQDWFARMISPGNSNHCYRLIFIGQNKPAGEISFHGLDSTRMIAEFNTVLFLRKRWICPGLRANNAYSGRRGTFRFEVHFAPLAES